MFQIDDHIGAVGAGYIPDARIQVDNARVIAQSNKLVYEEPVDIETVGDAAEIPTSTSSTTQYAEVRPFGVSLILAGVDKNQGTCRVYLTDPTGAYLSFDAIAIGAGERQVNEYLRRTTTRA